MAIPKLLSVSINTFFLLVVLLAALLGTPLPASAQGSGNLRPLDQWTATTSPDIAITQRTIGKALKITGLTAGECLKLDANNLLTTVACSSGSGSGSGTVGTSSAETATYVPFWSSTAGTPATLSGGESTFAYDSTLNKLTIENASTTALSIGSLSGLLKQAAGVVVAAVAGTDYEVPLTFGDGLTRTSNDVDCDTASGSVFGCLTAADWTTFNSKQAAGNYITALTGDVTASGPGSAAATLATVNANVGSFGTATQAPTLTVNAKGLVTAVSNTLITPAIGSITGLGTDVATALGVNVGSAGAFVVNGGALGTPISGTLTNATGLLPAGMNLTKGNFLVGNDAGVAQATSTIFVSSTGNIGIGTASPGALLDVSSSGDSTIRNSVANAGTAGANDLALWQSFLTGVRANYMWSNTNYLFGLASNNGSALTTEAGVLAATKLVMDNNGNVGIGTTTPAAKLGVAGDIYLTGKITATSTATSTLTGAVQASCFSTDGTTCITGGSSNTFTYPLVDTAGTISLAFGTTTANTWSGLQTFTNTGTTTFAGGLQAVTGYFSGIVQFAANIIVTGIQLAGDTITDFTGFGMSVASGALGLDTTGAADGECLKYESTGPTIDWATCGGGGEVTAFVGPGEGFFSGTGVSLVDSASGGTVAAIAMTDGNNNQLYEMNFRVPSGANGLAISKIEILYENAAASSLNIYGEFKTNHYAYSNGGTRTQDVAGATVTSASPSTSGQTGIITAPAAAYNGLPATVTTGDLVTVSFNRFGGEAQDTYGQTLYIIGAVITFQ